jgi:hypothetical protein
MYLAADITSTTELIHILAPSDPVTAMQYLIGSAKRGEVTVRDAIVCVMDELTALHECFSPSLA